MLLTLYAQVIPFAKGDTWWGDDHGGSLVRIMRLGFYLKAKDWARCVKLCVCLAAQNICKSNNNKRI